MPQGAVLYRWGQTVPGREKDALALFQENVGLLDDLVENGMIMGHYPYVSTNRDGGYWLVHGDMEKLGAVQMLPEVRAIQFKVQMMVTDWTAEWLVGGSADELAGPMELANAVLEGTA